jgi:hypothetical protein
MHSHQAEPEVPEHQGSLTSAKYLDRPAGPSSAEKNLSPEQQR